MTSGDPVALADAMLRQGRTAEAVAAIVAASRAGHREAGLRHALWQLIGDPVPRDLNGARASLRGLAQGGHHEAQLIEMALTANGSGAPANWPLALDYLAAAAADNSGATTVRTLIGEMSLDPAGSPTTDFTRQPLAPDGAVTLVRTFLTPAECDHIATSVTDLLEPALVVDPRTGRQVPHPIRTSDGAVIGPVREDLVIRAINHRIAAASGTPVAAGEALTVLRYRPGQQFRLHSDALPATRNQRVKTVLIYLNEGFVGGETVFPDHGITIRPVAGDAVIFTNTDAAGRPDPRARHAGLPVTRGVKWLATRWIRARPFDVWTGPEAG